MATFQSPFGDVTVEVAEGNEAAYHSAGWPLAGATAKAEPKAGTKPVKQEK